MNEKLRHWACTTFANFAPAQPSVLLSPGTVFLNATFQKGHTPYRDAPHLPQPVAVTFAAITNRVRCLCLSGASFPLAVLDPQHHEGRAPVFLVRRSSSPASARPGLGGVWRVTVRVSGTCLWTLATNPSCVKEKRIYFPAPQTRSLPLPGPLFPEL